jgi:hypothetical protein
VSLSVARIRAISIVLVLAFLAVTHLLESDEGSRAQWQYRLVIALGWGHLLAPLGRRRGGGGRACQAWLLGVCLTSWLFALYAALLARWPGVVVAALAISTWHTVENDRALGRIAPHALALPPLSRRLRDHLLPLCATVCVGLLALGTRDGSTLLTLGGDASWVRLASLLPGQPLLSWLLLAVARLRGAQREGRAGAASLRRRLLATHLPSMALCAALAVVGCPVLDPLRTLMLAPGVYLFWSLLHVGQTAWLRGLEGPRGP